MEAERNKDSQPCGSDAELEAILADLERQVMERTSELQEIRNCTHLLDQVNSEVLFGMGYEISRPLNGVIGLAQLMLKSNLDCNQVVCIETIIQSCHGLMRTLNSILETSRVENDLVEYPVVQILQQSSSKASDIQPLIDMNYVNKMKRDFPNGMFAFLLQQYFRDAEQTLLDLEQAVERRDSLLVKNLLHLLKGCSADFGVSAIVELCERHAMRLKHVQKMTKAEFVQIKQTYEGSKDQLLQAVGSGL